MLSSSDDSGLQIQQDLPHQRLEWKIERIGWVVMALVLLLALGGLLGPGPLSRATTSDRDSLLHVQYNRLARYQAPEQLVVRLGSGVAQAGKLRLWLNQEYVHNIELLHIDPEPASVEAGGDRLTYTFEVTGAGQTTVVFHFEPNTFGRTAVAIGVEGGPEVGFSQFNYP